MTLRVISGGQTGADIAGLWAAKLFGIPTGGWAPKNFITLAGNHPEMATTFGMKEHARSYRGRTIENLSASDLTIVCSQVMSAGTKLTIKECQRLKIPHSIFMIDPFDLEKSLAKPSLAIVRNTIRLWSGLGLFTVNIAGNSTANCPRAFEFTFKLCYRLFTDLGYKTDASETDWVMYQDKWE